MNCISVSMINETMNAKANEVPVLGMCGTMFCGSDRYPYVVIEVVGKATVRVTDLTDEDYENNLIVKDGVQYLQTEALDKYLPYHGETYTKRRNGRWIEKGHGQWGTGSIYFGQADSYRDPDF